MTELWKSARFSARHHQVVIGARIEQFHFLDTHDHDDVGHGGGEIGDGGDRDERGEEKADARCGDRHLIHGEREYQELVQVALKT